MKKKITRNRNISFLLESSQIRRMHLYVYLMTFLTVAILFSILVIIFPTTGLFGVIITLSVGIYMVYNRGKIVDMLIKKRYDMQRVQMKKEHKSGHARAMKRIIPRNRGVKLKIGGSRPIKERFENVRNKFKGKKKKDEYIEVE